VAARSTRVALLALLACVLLAGAGCQQAPAAPAPTPPTAPKEQMDAIAAQLQQTLGQRPDIAKAEVSYTNLRVTAEGEARVNLIVKGGAAVEPIVDETARLIWQSRLDPLRAITVSIWPEQERAGDGATPAPGAGHVIRSVYPSENDRAAMDRRYGVRPR
jgi:hypothetical protein